MELNPTFASFHIPTPYDDTELYEMVKGYLDERQDFYRTAAENRIAVHAEEPFTVTKYVSYTYYLNGKMGFGQDVNDVFYYARMKAVFYPY